jgi:hypothetical protein
MPAADLPVSPREVEPHIPADTQTTYELSRDREFIAMIDALESIAFPVLEKDESFTEDGQAGRKRAWNQVRIQLKAVYDRLIQPTVWRCTDCGERAWQVCPKCDLRPREEKPSLGEALDELESATVKLSHGGKPIPWRENANRYDKARSAVEALFSRATEERDRLREEHDAWKAFAQHQEWCRYCGEDGVPSCVEGNALRERTANLANLRELELSALSHIRSGDTRK